MDGSADARREESAMETETVAVTPAKAANKKQRGVYQHKPGEWWICYYDACGRRRREKAGTWKTARDLYIKRKNEALIGKKLPEKLRRATVTFAEIAKDALSYSKAHKRTYGDDVARMERILAWFRDRSV
jgi:hypothetical protein